MTAAILDRLTPPASDLVREAAGAGGAVIVYDRDDRIVWVSEGQRALMPCSDYVDETYSSLFWKIFNAGLIGTKSAQPDPSAWLEGTIAARRTSPNLDFVNTYPWGRMLVSHLLLDDGVSIQARLDMRQAGIDRYFGERDAGLGVLWALRVQRHMRGMQSALDSLPIAVGMVDVAGRLIHSNASFDDLVRDGDGLVLAEDECVKATDLCDDIVLEQAVAHIAYGTQPSTCVPIRRGVKSPLIAAVNPGNLPGTAVIMVSCFGEDHSAVAASLRQAFNLSPAEAEIAAGIGAGKSMAEIASTRGVGEKTAYNQVRSIKASLRRSQFAIDDLADIANIVTKIAAITSHNRPNH